MKQLHITNIRLIYVKGLLFFLTGLVAAGTLLAQHLEPTFVFLLVVSIWCFARSYYFAFYVIQHYVDDQYRFAGLGSFVAYLWSRTKNNR